MKFGKKKNKKVIFKMTMEKDGHADVQIDRPKELPWWKFIKLMTHTIIMGLVQETGYDYAEVVRILNLSEVLEKDFYELLEEMR